MLSKAVQKKSNSSIRIAIAFLVVGAASLVFSVLLNMQIAAFIGLGLVFWGAIFALAKTGKYVESSLLDSTAKSGYSTLDRIINDAKFTAKGFYIPAYPKDVVLPEYLKTLKDPVVYIAENFDGKPSVDEIASGKLQSEKTRGFFVTSPGIAIMMQLEKHLQMDLSKISLQELSEFLPKSITELVNLARNAEMTLTSNGADFKASGILFESFYKSGETMKSVSILGCPVVSAVASALAKTSGKTVIVKEQTFSPGNCGVHAVFEFLG